MDIAEAYIGYYPQESRGNDKGAAGQQKEKNKCPLL